MIFFKMVLISVMLPFSFAQAKSITVGGSAVKSIDPNIVVVSFEVWAKATTAKAAQQTSSSEFQRAKKIFDNFKVEKKDIQTESYSVSPEYKYDQKTQQNLMIGFRVGQSMTITLRKTDDIGGFLDGLVTPAKVTDRGISVSGITWDSDKRDQVEISGLADAVQDARKRADEIAKAAGVKIKNVENISHNVHVSAPAPRMYSKAMSAAQSDSSATELSAGQIKVKIEVQAEYEI